MSPSEELRAAADLLDSLAGEAVGDSWRWRHFGDDPDNLCRVVYYPPLESGESWQVIADDIWPESNAAYIAAMSPTVGKALAAWLRSEVEDSDASDYWIADEALAVARAILGGAA